MLSFKNMKDISLDFFGEKVSIQMPTSLASLRQAISDKFMFSPSDAAEVIISYVKDLGKKIIQTEQDFSNFISNKIGNINLDISPDSKLYLENYNTLKKESDENKKALEELLKRDEELKKKKEELMKAEMEKVNLLEQKILKLQTRKKKLEKKMKLQARAIEKEQKENTKKIQNLQKKLGTTMPQSPYPKKIVVKNANANQKKLKAKPEIKKEIHPFATCDCCKMCPIIGKRYKCKNHANIDFCEKCFKTKSKAYGLTFEVVDTKKIMKEIILKASSNRINTDGRPIHRMISCEGCGMNPIIGQRFKCETCENFNYCKNCHDLYLNMHGHPFVEVKPKFI